ncbi:hypothetical protein HDU97_003225 [Phlyctochytrium planicorne]|nr:hypothetical protein HDU97_003225 [Phlyctochytrium planicorne]
MTSPAPFFGYHLSEEQQQQQQQQQLLHLSSSADSLEAKRPAAELTKQTEVDAQQQPPSEKEKSTPSDSYFRHSIRASGDLPDPFEASQQPAEASRPHSVVSDPAIAVYPDPLPGLVGVVAETKTPPKIKNSNFSIASNQQPPPSSSPPSVFAAALTTATSETEHSSRLVPEPGLSGGERAPEGLGNSGSASSATASESAGWALLGDGDNQLPWISWITEGIWTHLKRLEAQADSHQHPLFVNIDGKQTLGKRNRPTSPTSASHFTFQSSFLPPFLSQLFQPAKRIQRVRRSVIDIGNRSSNPDDDGTLNPSDNVFNTNISTPPTDDTSTSTSTPTPTSPYYNPMSLPRHLQPVAEEMERLMVLRPRQDPATIEDATPTTTGGQTSPSRSASPSPSATFGNPFDAFAPSSSTVSPEAVTTTVNGQTKTIRITSTAAPSLAGVTLPPGITLQTIPKNLTPDMLQALKNLTYTSNAINAGYLCYSDPYNPLGYVLDPSLGHKCRPGFFCPYIDPAENYNSSLPVVCPPLAPCAIFRTYGFPCPAQGAFEPVVCKLGYYCPDQLNQIICPRGYFCPTGSITPRPCSWLSSCPPGSVAQMQYGPVIVALILDMVLLGFVLAQRRADIKKNNKELMRAKKDRADAAASFGAEGNGVMADNKNASLPRGVGTGRNGALTPATAATVPLSPAMTSLSRVTRRSWLGSSPLLRASGKSPKSGSMSSGSGANQNRSLGRTNSLRTPQDGFASDKGTIGGAASSKQATPIVSPVDGSNGATVRSFIPSFLARGQTQNRQPQPQALDDLEAGGFKVATGSDPYLAEPLNAYATTYGQAGASNASSPMNGDAENPNNLNVQSPSWFGKRTWSGVSWNEAVERTRGKRWMGFNGSNAQQNGPNPSSPLGDGQSTSSGSSASSNTPPMPTGVTERYRRHFGSQSPPRSRDDIANNVTSPGGIRGILGWLSGSSQVASPPPELPPMQQVKPGAGAPVPIDEEGPTIVLTPPGETNPVGLVVPRISEENEEQIADDEFLMAATHEDGDDEEGITMVAGRSGLTRGQSAETMEVDDSITSVAQDRETPSEVPSSVEAGNHSFPRSVNGQASMAAPHRPSLQGAARPLPPPLNIAKNSSTPNGQAGTVEPVPPGASVSTMGFSREVQDIVSNVFTDMDMARLVSSWQKGLRVAPNIRMELSFKNLCVKLPTGREVLKSVSGLLKSGRMTAIMGPSGSGKTTLMNVLLGKMKHTSGEIRINNQPSDPSIYRKVIGYVPQEDTMLRELTVREVILHSGRVRLPPSWTEAEVEEHIDNVIGILGLGHVMDIAIGDERDRGISGGQRKRVNVGIELAAVPLALLLDEPTSGLDATSALLLISLLSSITRYAGLTTVAILHQPRPEVFNLFDDVIMLAPNGQVAYAGPINCVAPYFQSIGFDMSSANVADQAMDILCGANLLRRRPDGIGTIGTALSSWEIAKIWEKRSRKLQRRKSKQQAARGLRKENQASSAATLDSDQIVSAQGAEGAVMSAGNDGSPPNGNAVAVCEGSAFDSFTSPEAEKLFYDSISGLLADRGASFLQQLLYCHQRSLVQQSRRLGALSLEIFVATFAGFLMGISLQGIDELYRGVYQGTYVILSPANQDWVGLYGLLIGIAVAMAGAPAGVKVFGEEKTVYWREASSGHSKGAYFLGKTIATIYRFIVSSLHFSAVYYMFAKPVLAFSSQYLIILLSFWGIYGLSCIVSMVVRRENAPLLAVVCGLFAAVFCGFGPNLNQARNWKLLWVWELSFNKWAAEAQYASTLAYYTHVYDTDRSAAFFGYSLTQINMDYIMILVIGIGLRIIGFVLLVLLNRDKQK